MHGTRATRSSRRNVVSDNVPTNDRAEDSWDALETTSEMDEQDNESVPTAKRLLKQAPATVKARNSKKSTETVRKAKATRSRRTKTMDVLDDSAEPLTSEATMRSPPVSPAHTTIREPRTSTQHLEDPESGDHELLGSVRDGALPTPDPSVTPEPVPDPLTHGISQAQDTIFQKRDSNIVVANSKPADNFPEKPMDIVVRTRALGLPQTRESEGPKMRMVIRFLNLTNFKSYAGRQEVGPFHASFSSVVGPNGSGKSNVIDSLLFVFGFRASKMRQGKISALIHNSAAHPDLDFCEVEVVFEEVLDGPAGKHETIPGSSLVIARKAYKNNSSDYFINGSKSSFTAVTTLLREKGIDLDHKRFLILQGEVESIAQMKPKAQSEHDDGLLEYLEDIIGTSKYKNPIEEAVNEIESLNEVCKEKSNRVQIVEKEKKTLEDQKNKALAIIRDENELVLKQSSLYQVYQAECEDNLLVSQEALEQMQTQLSEEIGKHKGSEDIIKQLETSHHKSQSDFESLELQTLGVLKEVAKCEKEKVRFEERRKFLLNKQKKLERLRHSSQLAASEASATIEKYCDDIERNNQEIADMERQMEDESKKLSNIRETLKGKTQTFSQAIAKKQASLEPWKERVSKHHSDRAVAQSELEMLRERASAGQLSIDEAFARTESIRAERQNKNDGVNTAVAGLAILKERETNLEKEIDELLCQEPELRSLLSGARQRADEARSSLQNSQSHGNVLNSLLRLKESGRIEGFHDRLGNLGTIDSKYDVAISTACPQLDSLVSDSVEVGQQCIDYLRKNKLGRANIICLDRLARRDMSQIETPEGAPRLFDLVKPKHSVFSPAFFSVLQNTLVADNLAQANRIAYGAKRWRVVTLDGQLIDVSGTMSGGGNRIAKGSMSSKTASDLTREQVTKLEEDKEQLEAQYQKLQERQRQLTANLKSTRIEIPVLETQIQKLLLEVASLDEKLKDSENRLEELKTNLSSTHNDDVQIKNLEVLVEDINAELINLHSQTSGIEDEIKQLQNKIMEIGGVELRMQKAKVDGLRDQMDTLGSEISDAEVARSKAQKDQSKHEKASEQAEVDIAAATKELEALEEEGQSLLRVVSEAKTRGEEAQSELDKKKEDLEELKRELEIKVAELNETRAAEIEMRNKLEENQKIYSENQKRLRYWTDKREKLSLQSVSDLEDSDERSATVLPAFTRDEMRDMSKDALKSEIAALEEKTDNVSVDLSVLEEYRRRAQEHASRFDDLQSAVSARDSAKKRCDELRRLRLEGFMEGFSMISLRLKEMYQMITMGGNAELELVDSLDPFSEGILFSVMPPKKSWKNISNLSGGEKTLSSLALVFALHHYKPTPLYVMDEIDAALDFRNVSIVASYIKERTKNAQFIVISLRNNMFELASRLVGVYKVNHMTRSVTVENRDYMVRRRT